MAQNLSVFDNRAGPFPGKLEIASGVSHACLLAMSLLKKFTWCTALEFQVSVLTSIWLFVGFFGLHQLSVFYKAAGGWSVWGPWESCTVGCVAARSRDCNQESIHTFSTYMGYMSFFENLQSFEIAQVGWKASGQKSLAHINQPP